MRFAYPSVAKERENRGVYITAFDTKRQLFSKPQFVKGPIVTVRPYGDQLFFTGADFGTLAKSNWPCDQPGQPDEEGFRVSVPDTLHGRASEALMRGDVDKAHTLLKEAKERGIALQVTNKALSALRNK